MARAFCTSAISGSARARCFNTLTALEGWPVARLANAESYMGAAIGGILAACAPETTAPPPTPIITLESATAAAVRRKPFTATWLEMETNACRRQRKLHCRAS